MGRKRDEPIRTNRAGTAGGHLLVRRKGIDVDANVAVAGPRVGDVENRVRKVQVWRITHLKRWGCGIRILGRCDRAAGDKNRAEQAIAVVDGTHVAPSLLLGRGKFNPPNGVAASTRIQVRVYAPLGGCRITVNC